MLTYKKKILFLSIVLILHVPLYSHERIFSLSFTDMVQYVTSHFPYFSAYTQLNKEHQELLVLHQNLLDALERIDRLQSVKSQQLQELVEIIKCLLNESKEAHVSFVEKLKQIENTLTFDDTL